jgi:hypothetical protein
MPWRASTVTEERLRFVARLLEGEAMTDVCRDFGISRKTGYKIFNRYQEQGLDALCDRSRRPVRYANQLPQQIERLIVRVGQGVFGEPGGTRTRDPMIKSHVLYRLSYGLDGRCVGGGPATVNTLRSTGSRSANGTVSTHGWPTAGAIIAPAVRWSWAA